MLAVNHPVVERMIRTGTPYASECKAVCPRCGAELYEGERLYYDTVGRANGGILVCGECLREKYEALDTETFLLCLSADSVTL